MNKNLNRPLKTFLNSAQLSVAVHVLPGRIEALHRKGQILPDAVLANGRPLFSESRLPEISDLIAATR